eukprot:TRINITY_DN16892_c0_g1_i1.p1 TRINITY_DN16892_c0_g1~~TRINITY_DN16892_c0_g1_i1.p1  ORF type:complete len:273 (+),score=58.22 TRINITY_DN16892_c0_g1_i1:52-870(+)
MRLFATLAVLSCFCTASGKKKKGEDEVVIHKFPMQYSLDGKEWNEKGFLWVGELYQIGFEGSFDSWSNTDALGETAHYFVRIAQTPAEGFSEMTAENSVQIGVSTCELINSAFSEHFRVTFAPHDDNKKRIVGLAPYGSAYVKTRAMALDACTSDSLKEERLSKVESTRHQVIMADRPPRRPAIFDKNSKEESIYTTQVNQQAEKARKEKQRKERLERGEPAEEPQEKSFFEKYGMYLGIAFLLMQLQGGAAQPEGEAAGGGGGGGGGGNKK